jgi:hypothetical protein
VGATHYPDRFEIAARAWAAEDKIITDCGSLVERPEFVSVAGRLDFRLDQMKAMSGRRSRKGFWNALAGFLDELVDDEDRL